MSYTGKGRRKTTNVHVARLKVDDNYEGKIVYWSTRTTDAIVSRDNDEIGYCVNKLQYFIHKQTTSLITK